MGQTIAILRARYTLTQTPLAHETATPLAPHPFFTCAVGVGPVALGISSQLDC